jgi:HAD superfamily hydrolase (TIGR01549 family)
VVREPSGSVIEAVLFDFRGTVFGDEDDSTWVRNSAASIGRELDDASVDAIVARLKETESEPHIKADLDACDHSLEAHRAALLQWFRAADIDDELAYAIWARDGEADASFPYPDTHEVMEELSRRKIRIAVVSNIHYDLRPHFQRHDLDRFVDEYVLSFELGFQKPDPRMYTTALTRLGVEPEQALMVGDRHELDAVAADAGILSLILPATPAGTRRGLDAVLRLVG